jgi:hypothetical protein
MREIEFISPLDAYDQNRIRVHLITEDGDLKDRWDWYRERYVKKLKTT